MVVRFSVVAAVVMVVVAALALEAMAVVEALEVEAAREGAIRASHTKR